MPEIKDVFICHASEDKQDIVRPLAAALDAEGISYWLDKIEIKWGDSISKRISKGLAESRFAVVVLSKNFLKTNYAQQELKSLIHEEASTGIVKVLPLLVGTENEIAEIRREFTLIGDKLSQTWTGDPYEIVSKLRPLLGLTGPAIQGGACEIDRGADIDIPIPKLKKRFAQLDKDIFLEESFTVIRNYFSKALSELEKINEGITTKIQDVSSSKFVVSIYRNGDLVSKCNIRYGNQMGSNSLNYSVGKYNVENDNSSNEIFSVADDGYSIGFEPIGMLSILNRQDYDPLMSALQTAEYLWKAFSHNLN